MSENFFVQKKRETGVSLNDVQKKAVIQTEGPLLLLASPGSGKTTTMIMRIGYLIQERNIPPSRIKAVTFSRASAMDMKKRFEQFFPELPSIDFSTIHSFAFEAVREHFWKKNIQFQMIEGDVEKPGPDGILLHKKVILHNLYESIVGEKMTEDQFEELTTYISFLKNKMVPENQWATVKCGVTEAERIVREYESFKQSRFSKLLVDFDDMLTIGNRILEEDEELLRKYQQRYDYILTDESQDTSLVQHSMIEKLAQRHKNLCVVADDDQSIYSWRGAEPSYLLNFKEIYPNAAILFMEQNYRSSQEIVDTSNMFIKQNKDRYEKNMFTKNGSQKPIIFKNLSDYKLQAKYLVREIQESGDLSEIAVLYRNNASSITLMNEFDRAGIPFYMKDADNRFFSHWVVEDILNFMRMAYTDKRADLLGKIHTKMNGYITKQQMQAVLGIRNDSSVFDNLVKYAPLKDYQVKKLMECKETFQQMKGMPPFHAIQVIRERLGYEKAIERMCERLGFRKEYLIGILNTLEDIAHSLETMEDFAKRLQHLASALKTSKFNTNKEAVTFSTFHSAKGLEFERVYMIDLVDGVIPSAEDRKGDMEEAVRLFYVGMTRSKSHLELISYRQRDGADVVESKFVGDIRNIIQPPREIKSGVRRGSKKVAAVPLNPNAIRDKARLKTGMSVKHKVFGTGTVESLSEETVKIKFPKQEKALSLETCLVRGLLEPV